MSPKKKGTHNHSANGFGGRPETKRQLCQIGSQGSSSANSLTQWTGSASEMVACSGICCVGVLAIPGLCQPAHTKLAFSGILLPYIIECLLFLFTAWMILNSTCATTESHTCLQVWVNQLPIRTSSPSPSHQSEACGWTTGPSPSFAPNIGFNTEVLLASLSSIKFRCSTYRSREGRRRAHARIGSREASTSGWPRARKAEADPDLVLVNEGENTVCEKIPCFRSSVVIRLCHIKNKHRSLQSAPRSLLARSLCFRDP